MGSGLGKNGGRWGKLCKGSSLKGVRRVSLHEEMNSKGKGTLSNTEETLSNSKGTLSLSLGFYNMSECLTPTESFVCLLLFYKHFIPMGCEGDFEF